MSFDTQKLLNFNAVQFLNVEQICWFILSYVPTECSACTGQTKSSQVGEENGTPSTVESGAAGVPGSLQTWGFLRATKKAIFTSEAGSPLLEKTILPGTKHGKEEGSVSRGLASHRRTQDFWGWRSQLPQPDEPGGGKMKFWGALEK